jgi:transglutaminase-like putative cysteine protease
MLYSVRQVTTYHYASIVPFARHALRLTPASRRGQTVTASAVSVDPEPHERSESDDFFGNRVTHVAIARPHRTLTISSQAEVRVDAPAMVQPDATPVWTELRDQAAASRDGSGHSPAHHIFPSRLVPIDPTLRTYAATSFPTGRPVFAGGIDLMARIKHDFAYDPTATDVTTPVAEAFALRRGVCQDFAHMMIAGLRALGLPAAYVSGYLRTEPLPGQPRLQGADATHAWAAMWCGEEAGWQGLDPTNNIRVGGNHIALAFGRDYADVSPVDGVIVASGGHTLSVSVDVVARPGAGEAG